MSRQHETPPLHVPRPHSHLFPSTPPKLTEIPTHLGASIATLSSFSSVTPPFTRPNGPASAPVEVRTDFREAIVICDACDQTEKGGDIVVRLKGANPRKPRQTAGQTHRQNGVQVVPSRKHETSKKCVLSTVCAGHRHTTHNVGNASQPSGHSKRQDFYNVQYSCWLGYGPYDTARELCKAMQRECKI